MGTTNRGNMLPWLSLFTIWLVWGSTYLGMSMGVETIPPFFMTAMRFYLAGPLLLLLVIPAWRRGEIHVTKKQAYNSAVIGVLLLLGGTGLGAVAQLTLDSSFAALMISLSPIWMALFSSLRTRTTPDSKVFGALIVGLIGIAIMIGGPGSGHISLIGVVVIAGSAIFWSFGTVHSRFIDLPENSIVSTGLQMLFGGTALMLLAFLFGEFGELSLAAISSRSWIGFWWLVVGGSLLGYNAYGYANRTLPIEIVSTYAYVNPVIAVILGAWLDNDPLGPNVLIGGTVILLAVVFIVSGHIARRGPVEQT